MSKLYLNEPLAALFNELHYASLSLPVFFILADSKSLLEGRKGTNKIEA